MKKTISALDKLKLLIRVEKNNYTQAIRNNQTFREVKLIYLKIKSLEKDMHEMMHEANAGQSMS